MVLRSTTDRKSTRLNSSHADIYTLSLHDALPIYDVEAMLRRIEGNHSVLLRGRNGPCCGDLHGLAVDHRSEEHTSELQSRRYLHSFPTRRSSDLRRRGDAAQDRRQP